MLVFGMLVIVRVNRAVVVRVLVLVADVLVVVRVLEAAVFVVVGVRFRCHGICIR